MPRSPAPAQQANDHSDRLVVHRRFWVAVTYCSFYEECWEIQAP